MVGASKFSRWEMVCVPPPHSASPVKKVALICVLLFLRESYLEAVVKVKIYTFSGVNGRGKVMQAIEVKKEHREN